MAISNATKCHSQGLDCNKQGREEESSREEKMQQDGEAGARATEETAGNMAFFLCRMKFLCATSRSKCRCTWVCTSRTTAVKPTACGTTPRLLKALQSKSGS
jgi:hypothetical protein